MRRRSFHPSARREFLEATEWYAVRDPRVALDFIGRVEDALALLTEFPEAGVALAGGRRRIGMQQFPYLIAYRLTTRGIRILAVYHGRRRGDHWTRRR